ncbi:class I SAM-dependent DNA methyltransferase [Nesterenkonia sp. CF4.4]|uniref:class I SAM-dependent DNA methyltransferase n=1 Tax=Nesterenkonia sp. CF4.4 TaxID=3373079 RepID=UPI003EE6EC18
MTEEEHLRVAYGRRAAEYSSALGTMDQMDPRDREKITLWAEDLPVGPVLDAGCGPGHWTAHLRSLGVDISGLDLVPEFIGPARSRFPDVTFREGSMTTLDVPDGSQAGILAWYSLIHTPPTDLPEILRELHRALRPEGRLLIGFFHGPDATPFAHEISTAYSWSIESMRERLVESGFMILETDHRQDPGRRAHASITAQPQAHTSAP